MSLIDRARRYNELRWRRPPRLTVHPASGNPTVYYLTPHLAVPSGGVRNMYRHVDLLNRAGIPAAVLHAPAGFRCTWFANDTRVVSASSIRLCQDDVLVVPECYGPGFHLLPEAPRKIIFNQGAYHTFDHIPFDRDAVEDAPEDAAPAELVSAPPPYRMKNLVGLLTVSRDSADLLEFAFGGLPVWRARLVIDGAVFHPGDCPRARTIAYLPDRRPAERHQLLHLLRAGHGLRGWDLVEISGRTERQVAELLRTSAIFLSFSEREGFGLPPAEAMASGCYVVGYPGGGGREFFDPSYCDPIDDGDLLGFARGVVRAMRGFDGDPALQAALGAKASAAVLSSYHRDGLIDDLMRVYRPLLGL